MINLFRKKKKLKSMLAVTAASMMLCTGCVRSGVGVVIEPNDTGTVEISVGINEKYIDTIREQTGGMEPFEGKNTATLTDGENSYICITESKQFSNLDELKTILLELEYNFDALEGEDSSETNETESADEHEIDVWINADGEEIFFEDDEPSKAANTASTRPSARSKPATSTDRIGHAHGALYHTTSATIPAGTFPPP